MSQGGGIAGAVVERVPFAGEVPGPFVVTTLRPAGSVTTADDVRRLLREQSPGVDGAPVFTARQTHGNRVLRVGSETPADFAWDDEGCDGLLTTEPGVVLAIRTADCLPVVLTTADGRALAIIHAGWRGTLADIVPIGVRLLAEATGERPASLLATLGPCISGQVYEVGEDVREPAMRRLGANVALGLAPGSREGKWLLDLHAINRLLLLEAGLRAENILAMPGCTFREAERYHSYRRDGTEAGRMATIGWVK